MSAMVADKLANVPLKPVKAGLRRGDSALNPVESAGDLVVKALNRAGISQKAAAITMEMTEPQFTRQLRGQEHLSLQRLSKLPDQFWSEFIVVIAEARGVATVETQIRVRRAV